MAACRHCGATFEPGELVRHERPRLTVVHCPDCGCLLGVYRRHGEGLPRA